MVNEDRFERILNEVVKTDRACSNAAIIGSAKVWEGMERKFEELTELCEAISGDNPDPFYDLVFWPPTEIRY